MTFKAEGAPGDWQEIDRTESEVGWIAYPAEGMARASHAVAVDGDVWVIDPVDVPDLDELLSEFGEVRGVVVLLDRHTRDAADVARRHEVPVYLPEQLSGLAGSLSADVETVETALPDTNFHTLPIVNRFFWTEVALYDADRGTLVVPEAVGTAEHFLSGEERLGVHPMLRLRPPRSALGGIEPDRIRVGHGEGIGNGATAALDEALRGARRRAPSLWASIGSRQIRG